MPRGKRKCLMCFNNLNIFEKQVPSNLSGTTTRSFVECKLHGEKLNLRCKDYDLDVDIYELDLENEVWTLKRKGRF